MSSRFGYGITAQKPADVIEALDAFGRMPSPGTRLAALGALQDAAQAWHEMDRRKLLQEMGPEQARIALELVRQHADAVPSLGTLAPALRKIERGDDWPPAAA